MLMPVAALLHEPALTARQREVVALACADLTDEQIAARLGIDSKTVSTHLHHAREKLGIEGSGRGAFWRAQLGEHRGAELRRYRLALRLISTGDDLGPFTARECRAVAAAALVLEA